MGTKLKLVWDLDWWYRLREQVHREIYRRERDATVEFDDVAWPVDLGEAGA